MINEARRTIERAFAGSRSKQLVAVAVRAPSAPLLSFAGDARDAILLDPFCATRGVTRELVTSKIDELAPQARALFAKIEVQGLVPPRLVGGFAFRATEAEEWRGFPATRFILPRWTYLGDALIHCGEDRDSALDELEKIYAELANPRPQIAAHPLAIESEPTLARWTVGVEDALAAIRAHRAEKIVLARSSRITFDRAIDDRAVIEALERPQAGLRFLVRAGDASFAGATPERLIKKRGELIEADALAGTSTAEELDVLAEPKTLREHHLVVRYISEKIAPFLVARESVPAPSIRAAGAIRHLYTPLKGRAKPNTSLFTLAAALHPTPAVCGLPRNIALETIAKTERFDRGWYSGAVGWVDANGDGELYVALRCALLRKDRAYLYAGAGIVEGSRASDEYLETSLKERVMMHALGATP